jgi:PPM family protein phosphatase
MKLSDLAESARSQVAAGLPAGTLEQADAQLRRLATESLLPLCPLAALSRRNHNRAPGRRSPRPPVNLR